MPAKKTAFSAPSSKPKKPRATITIGEAAASLPPAPGMPKGAAAPFVKGHDPRRYTMIPRLQRVSDMKRRMLAKSGMTPLDFLTAVYRDELYDDYEPVQFTEVADDRLLPYARVWKPTDDARRVKVNLDQRIVAANQAAPYFHSKRPVQLNLGNAGSVAPASMTDEQMEALTTEELEAIIRAGEVLGTLPSTGKNMVRLGTLDSKADKDDGRTVDMPK